MTDDEVAVDPRLDRAQEGDPDELVEVVVRLAKPGEYPDGLIVAAEIGDIVTGEALRKDLMAIHASDKVESVKTAERLVPDDPEALGDIVDEADTGAAESDDRRPRTDTASGHGAIVAVIDWWFDVPHQAFRKDDGTTRILALWDQREVPGAPGTRPARYGYGRVLDRATINHALQQSDAYTALNYRPWDGDSRGTGTHGTHVAGIAAGSRSVAPGGVAPDADLLLVHLVDRSRDANESLGSSKSLIDAIDWIARTAGSTPWVLDTSMGRHADAHLGLSLVERAVDAAISAAAGRFCCQSAGNYYRNRTHAAVLLDPGDQRHVRWEIAASDPTANELEIWYSGHDAVDIEIRSPDGRTVHAAPGERSIIRDGTREICRLAHRRDDPNTHQNNAVCFLDASAPSGTWTVTLTGVDIVDGRVNLWIERDPQPSAQSHFHVDDAVRVTTTGSICNGFRTAAIGAYDAATADRAAATFSSVGPTVDGRRKPTVAASGRNILGPKSAPSGSTGATSGTTRMSGTSMATPMVAGLVACMYEAAGRPLSSREIRHLLVQSADPVPDTTADPERYGHGWLNMDRALERTREWVRAHPTVPRETTEQTETETQIETTLEGFEDEPTTIWTIVSDDARLRTGPPAFARDGSRKCALFDQVLVAEANGRYRRITDRSGAELGWTSASNLFAFLKDLPRLATAALAPATTVAGTGTPEERAIASTYNRIGGLVGSLATELGIEPAAVLAVWQVESGGRAWTSGSPVLRVENHLFFQSWGRHHAADFDKYLQFGTRAPMTAATTACGQKCDAVWRCHRSRQNETDDFTCDHTSQQRERDVLALMTRLADEETALRSSSLGGPQILGENHARCGYRSAVAMRDAFAADERWEVIAFFDFCRKGGGLISALHDRRWTDFARGYNGSGQAAHYGHLVETAYNRATTLLAPPRPAPVHERWEIADAWDVDGEIADACNEDTPIAPRWGNGGGPAFTVVGRPGERLDEPLQAGDVILRRGAGTWADSLAVVASPRLLSQAEASNVVLQPGEHVEAYMPANGHPEQYVPVRIATREGLVPTDTVALRPAVAPAIEAVPDETYAIPVPATPWPAAATVLPAAQLERARHWNAERHPTASGIDVLDIRARVARYVDAAAVTSALTAAGIDPAAADGGFDNALCESIHQFQAHVVVRGADGAAGPQTLDDLGFVDNRLHPQRSPQPPADAALRHHAPQVDQASGGWTAATWWQGIVECSFLGQPIRNGIHRVLLRRLRRAERLLLGQQQFAGKTPVQLGLALGIARSDSPSGWRPVPPGANMHSFGLAIDVAPYANPYIGGNVDASTSNRAFSGAMQRAALVVSGEHLPESFSTFLGRLGADRSLDTAQIHRTLAARDADLRVYLRLADSDAALRDRIAPNSALRPELAQPNETVEAAVARWHQTVATDLQHLNMAGSNFNPRDARHGFLNLPVELVVALREGACLAWGAVDFGSVASGDMMHFDTRVDGVGAVLIGPTPGVSRGGWRPVASNSNHPCAQRPAASDTET